MKILFICKHNIFRSRIAEEYFNKTNKDRSIKASGAGIIAGFGLSKVELSTVKVQQATAKEFGLDLKIRPTSTTVGLLKKQDLIVNVADDIPEEIFSNKHYVKKLVCWNIPDAPCKDKVMIRKTIKQIITKIDSMEGKWKQ